MAPAFACQSTKISLSIHLYPVVCCSFTLEIENGLYAICHTAPILIIVLSFRNVIYFSNILTFICYCSRYQQDTQCQEQHPSAGRPQDIDWRRKLSFNGNPAELSNTLTNYWLALTYKMSIWLSTGIDFFCFFRLFDVLGWLVCGTALLRWLVVVRSVGNS